MALFMVIGLISLSFTGLNYGKGQSPDHILGGPAAEMAVDELGAPTPGDSLGAAFLGQDVDNYGKSSQNDFEDFSVAAVRDLGGLADSLTEPKKTPFIYEAQSGDTLISIATSFGISLETVIHANPALRNASLKEGQKLTILPVSGVLHTVVAKDSLSSISSLYKVDQAKIEEFNPTVKPSALALGAKLVIPGAKPKEPVVAAASAKTAKVSLASAGSGYFIQPAAGFNWGILHGHNGVDIANSYGTAIVAAAEGLVIPDSACQMDDGWNGGYGMCIMLQHPNGLKTLYAHLSGVKIKLGDYVVKGQLIGLMGSSGKSTGSHLHFEVRGASNPFIR